MDYVCGVCVCINIVNIDVYSFCFQFKYCTMFLFIYLFFMAVTFAMWSVKWVLAGTWQGGITYRMVYINSAKIAGTGNFLFSDDVW